jgi:hypothetical protein
MVYNNSNIKYLILYILIFFSKYLAKLYKIWFRLNRELEVNSSKEMPNGENRSKIIFYVKLNVHLDFMC